MVRKGFKKEKRGEYTDLAVVESQRNDLTAEEFPEGPYGSPLLVETLGKVLGLETKRIQFTPDLMPSDIIGSEVLEDIPGERRSFRFIPGPIFTQLLMADEINRASPKTQSALLQAMQEHHVTVAGQRYDVPTPFHVLATQNPLEQEGTYPLPEAQLDRFLLQIDVSYPDVVAERRMLFATTGADPDGAGAHGDAAPRAPDSGAGQGCRGHSAARSLGATRAGRQRRDEPAHRLGTRAPRQPGADAGGPREGFDRRPSCPVGR